MTAVRRAGTRPSPHHVSARTVTFSRWVSSAMRLLNSVADDASRAAVSVNPTQKMIVSDLAHQASILPSSGAIFTTQHDLRS